VVIPPETGTEDTDTQVIPDQETITVPADPLEICINEFMPDNERSWLDDRDIASDWIELHNPLFNSVSLDGWSLTDDEDDPHKSPLDGLVLPAGAYLVLAADNNAQLGDLHLDFALSADGDTVALFREDGSGEIIHYGAMNPDTSQARQPDCGSLDSFEPTIMGSPGATNVL